MMHKSHLKIGLVTFAMFFFTSGTALLADIGSLYEQLLRTEPAVQNADRDLNLAYKALRDTLDAGNRAQLKNAQLNWINARDRDLAATPPQQRSAVAAAWSARRTQEINAILNPGRKPLEPDGVPARPESPAPIVRPPLEIPAAEIQLAADLAGEIAALWKDAGADAKGLPPQLPIALVARMEKLQPRMKTDPAEITKARFPGIQLAYAIDQALGTKPANLHAVAELLVCGQRLKPQEVPWLGVFSRVLQARRTQALALQEEAMELLKKEDPQAAEARLVQATSIFPSPAISTYAAGLALFNILSQDKALRAVDGDWKKPSMPDPALLRKVSEQVVSLRTAGGDEVLPALAKLTNGLEAAQLLGSFQRDYEPAGDKDQPHPIRALQALRKTEKYRVLQADDSLFVKPFLVRLKALDELIGPKADVFGGLLIEAQALEKNQKFLEAASKYRAALNLEPSRDLEQTIYRCEAKTSGL